MWSRPILKNNAKEAIRGNKFWVAYLVSIFVVFFPSLVEWMTGYTEVNKRWVRGLDAGVFLVEPSVFMAYNIGYLLFSVFIVMPLVVGLHGFFVRNRFNAGKFSDVFMSFRNGYAKVVLTSVVTNLFIVLWALLLIIPGIYKFYQYILIPFILSDNPQISGSRARQISRMMTDGEKASIFVLTLSFLGWFVLVFIGMFLLAMVNLPDFLINVIISLGVCLITPYFYASMAELYIFLRDRAIQTGMVQPEELNLAV